ncbi:GGDEF domain-containing protein [Neorhodopirellula pilleata]|uniref:diguanylate cyclase n=1 Tax=Neorhodopirellula pilleata TaxID=2714738 RepID=A0A5C6AWZ4_9BACT|nr:GGDEF domain-containing protein [Neorhodopirellula pilleata]TWU03679.1 putative diguanylate cyclase YdaM [Neorhodopirellula pilleata]
MLFDFVIAVSFVSTGLCLGWVAHALYRAGVLSSPAVSAPAPESSNVEATSVVDSVATALAPEQVTAVADRIRSFAATIAASIDTHQTKLEAVSSTLSGTDLTQAPPGILEAVEQLLSANASMRQQLQESQERLREQSKQLQSAEQRAQTDALTGVTNRGEFDQRIGKRFALGPSQAGVLVLADIDHFKRFNDEHGHRAGDEVLRQVARGLEARLEPYGTVARFGGEEFAMLIEPESLNTPGDFDEILQLVEQTRISVSTREIQFEEKRLKVSLSVGIGELQPDQTLGEWVQKVDDALYRSKECGRNCSHYVSADRIIRVASPSPALAGTMPEHSLQANGASGSGVATANRSVVDGSVATLATKWQPANVDESVDHHDPLRSLMLTLDSTESTERPKTLGYLPDQETLIEGVLSTLQTRRLTNRPHYFVAIQLSGNPSGALMRSLLQLVRAAMRSQDRIGCINHNTLLIHLPECDEADVNQRAEQICLSAGSIGVQLASIDREQQSERLSIGINRLDFLDELSVSARKHSGSSGLPDANQIREAIVQSRAVALLAARQPAGAMPIYVREAMLESMA